MNLPSEPMHPAPTLLLLSMDGPLTEIVSKVARPPWNMVSLTSNEYADRRALNQPNVRLVILDDQSVVETDRGWLLAHIRKDFPGTSLIYVAGGHSDENERRARTNGAHYYISKPLSPERFGQVVESFIRAEQIKV